MGRHDQEILRRFVAARERGDAAGMQRWWEEVVITIFDRVDGFVGLAHRGRLDDEEHDTAVELALARISSKLMTSFRGTTMGELINAIKTLAHYICMDVQRTSVSVGHRTSRSLDAGWDAGTEDGPAPSWEVAAATDEYDREVRSAEINAFLDWAYPQLAENRRAVVRLSYLGCSIPEICTVLGIERDNAYQLRKRGLADLAKLKQQYDAS